MRETAVMLDRTIPAHPRLIVEIPPDRAAIISNTVDKLISCQRDVREIILAALQTAQEQAYFWTPAWQAQERAVEQALAEGRVRVFNDVEDMIEFLDGQ